LTQEWIGGLPELMGQAVEASPAMGYLAVGLVMLLENLSPPIPSEVVMPFAGYLVGQGRLDLVPTVLAGLLGTVLGAWFWYGIGRLIPEPRLALWVEGPGRWLGIRAEQLARSRDWFQRHGSALVFSGRLVPGVRTLVSVPAGIERMPQGPFLLWTTAGSLVWTLLLTLAGKALGQGYERVQDGLAPWAQGVERGLVMALAAGLVVWLVRLVWQRLLAE
jgi:uncharacterized membrane protein YdjX (TVP38/TMEM64 family)